MPEAPKMTPSDLKMNPGTFQDLPKWTPRAPKVTTQPPKISQWHPMAPNVNTMVPKIHPKTSKALPNGAQRPLKQLPQPTATSQQPQLQPYILGVFQSCSDLAANETRTTKPAACNLLSWILAVFLNQGAGGRGEALRYRYTQGCTLTK